MRRPALPELSRRASRLAPLEGRSPSAAEGDDTLCRVVGGEDVTDRLAFEGESGGRETKRVFDWATWIGDKGAAERGRAAHQIGRRRRRAGCSRPNRLRSCRSRRAARVLIVVVPRPGAPPSCAASCMARRSCPVRESQRKRNVEVLLRTPAAAPVRYLRMQRQVPGFFCPYPGRAARPGPPPASAERSPGLSGGATRDGGRR